MVVVAVIAILSIVGMAAYGNVQKNARDAKRKADIHIIRNALDAYYMDHGKYPSVSVYSVSKDVTEDGWTNAVGGTQYYASGKAPVDPINEGTYYYKYEGVTSVPLKLGRICATALEDGSIRYCLDPTQ
ncbi:hypothetical protein A3C26_02190 [Candidatus Daviesbacteria bacterium RIFCSPHIGHO2_02_FULL_39_12]|uniref:Type II secretion system protein GspG C-terminal domain-containing protein n=2 Tax=Candidatus Daviesiibacteriota TaxID=1752718 RepID=A0A1F5JA32_9BACT|nr:MAG: hypothetical protein A3C26_02190 [Candidatus Daviesbacteria bacterium RIFCSPHIGHO2_02_FULL_39_12]OGE71666.1 MAG: hypothetical protein A3H40_01500 [Candidatus Daviesbacteria bacterium RIFCSPLOWO2_02_FULL_38_15]